MRASCCRRTDRCDGFGPVQTHFPLLVILRQAVGRTGADVRCLGGSWATVNSLRRRKACISTSTGVCASARAKRACRRTPHINFRLQQRRVSLPCHCCVRRSAQLVARCTAPSRHMPQPVLELLHRLGELLRFCGRAVGRISGLEQLISQCAPQRDLLFQLQLRFVCALRFGLTQTPLLLRLLPRCTQLHRRLSQRQHFRLRRVSFALQHVRAIEGRAERLGDVI